MSPSTSSVSETRYETDDRSPRCNTKSETAMTTSTSSKIQNALNVLSNATLNTAHVVRSVTAPAHAPEWHRWLEEIGFIPGERVTLMARGMLGGDPLVVRVGASTFALRRAEAACVHLTTDVPAQTRTQPRP